MSGINLTLSELTTDEKNQIFDLLMLSDLVPQTQHDPVNDLHSISILINESAAFDINGLFTYILKHIIKN